jgi:hypothetical protein
VRKALRTRGGSRKEDAPECDNVARSTLSRCFASRVNNETGGYVAHGHLFGNLVDSRGVKRSSHFTTCQELTYFLDSHFLKLCELGCAHVWMQSALGLLLLALGRRALNDGHERLAEHFLFTWPRRRE